MAGLLSGVLPAVFSAGNKLKRQIGGLLSDPVGAVQQQVGLLNDKAGAFNQLTAQAAQEHVNSLKTGGGMGQAQMKLANTLADSYNPVGMFVGVNAKTADKAMLAKAQQMLDAGADSREVWAQTGWFRGPDGKMRFEIDDSAARTINKALPENEIVIQGQSFGRHPDFSLGDAMKHDELFAAYPDTPGIRMSFNTRSNEFGSYNNGMDWISLSDQFKRPTLSESGAERIKPIQDQIDGLLSSARYKRYDKLTDAILEKNGGNFTDPRLIRVIEKYGTPIETKRSDLRGLIDQIKDGSKTGSSVSPAGQSTMLHELQHAIQKREGFASGGTPESAYGLDIAEALKAVRKDKAAIGIDPYAIQNRLAARYPVPAEDLAKYKEWQGLTAKEDGLLKSMAEPYEAYKRLAGEAEARATQARMNLTAEQRRALFPLDSYDVPIDSLIFK